MKEVIVIIVVLVALVLLALWLRRQDKRIAEEREEGGTGLAVLLSIVGLAAVVGAGLLIYFLVYATADVRGRVAVHNEVLSGQSRLELTRHFHDLYANIQAQQEQAAQNWAVYLSDKANASSSDPFGQQRQQIATDLQNYNGVVQLCIQNANDYNQQAQDTTRGLFIEASLPTNVNPKDCEAK